MFKRLIRNLVANTIVSRIKSSWTAAVAGVGIAGGVAVTIDPELLSLVPEEYRPVAIILYSVAVLVARVRREIVETFGSQS